MITLELYTSLGEKEEREFLREVEEALERAEYVYHCKKTMQSKDNSVERKFLRRIGMGTSRD